MNKKIIGLFILAVCIAMAIIYQPEKITIKLGVFSGSNWDVPSGESNQIVDNAIKIFEEIHPNVKVKYESGILKEDYSSWLADKILTGDTPDVYIILEEDFSLLSSIGALKNLNSYILKDKNFDEQEYYKSVLEAGTYNGYQYALPYECDPTLMFVNKTLLQKEGIEIPNNDWTLDDFYEICQKVTRDSNNDGIIDQYGCYDYDWLDSIYSHGILIFNDQGTKCDLSQDSVKESITFVQKINNLNQGHIVSSDEFDKGQVAFSPMPLSQYRTYQPYPWKIKKYSRFEWDCVKMPTHAKNVENSEVSTLLMGISSRSKHDSLAWDLLKTLTYNQQSQAKLVEYSQGLSPLKTVVESQATINLLKEESGDRQVSLNLLNEGMENTTSHGKFKKYESALDLINTRVDQIILNNDDLDTSLTKLQKELNQYLKE